MASWGTQGEEAESGLLQAASKRPGPAECVGCRRGSRWAGPALFAAVALALLAYAAHPAGRPAAAAGAQTPVGATADDAAAYLGLSEQPTGSCKVGSDFCTGKVKALLWRDCDDDGIVDPYCEDSEQLKFGFKGSASECNSTWPNGFCMPRTGASLKKEEVVERAPTNEITFIHFNDVYQVAGIFSGGFRRGGMSRAAEVIKRERARNPDRTFVVFAGDLLSPSVLSDLFKGAQMVDILNHLNIDAASLGNHEFDFGMDVFFDRVKESEFPWLNINLHDAKTGSLMTGTQRHLIRDVPWAPLWLTGGKEYPKIRVCFFGAAYNVSQTVFREPERIGYKDILNETKAEVASLQKQGCNVTVALTHQLWHDDCAMSREMGGGIDLILGGHDHDTMINYQCGKTPWFKADSDLKAQIIVRVLLSDDGKVRSVEPTVLQLTDADPFDVAVHGKVLEWEEKGRQKLAGNIGCSDVDLDATTNHVRQEESRIGNFFTDAIRNVHKTELVIVNTGGIRGNRVYANGNLSRLNLNSMHPFGNKVAKIYVTGKQLRDFLETTLECYESICGDFVAVSGFKYSCTPGDPAGSRLRDVALANDAPLRDDQEYTLALPDYVLSTARGLKDNRLYNMVTLNDAVPMVDALAEYLEKHQPNCIAPERDGRITVM